SSLLELLRCPVCGDRLAPQSAPVAAESIACAGGQHVFPILHGIPRFVAVPEDELARRTQASFGYEWTRFSDWRQSGEVNFNDYFAGTALEALASSLVLDAGCGMGRHAR